MELMPGVLPPGWKNFAVKVPRILEVTESRGPPKIPKTRKHHADEDIPKEDGAEQTRKDMAITGAEQSTKEDMAITGAAPDGDIIEGGAPAAAPKAKAAAKARAAPKAQAAAEAAPKAQAAAPKAKATPKAQDVAGKAKAAPKGKAAVKGKAKQQAAAGAGVAGAAGALGCAKCRWSPGGCVRCRARAATAA